MYPTIKILGNINIPIYGTLFFAGSLIAVLLMILFSRNYGIDWHDVLYSAVYILIGIGIGAKAMYFFSKIPRVIIHFDTYIKLIKTDTLSGINYLFGGLTFYGGLFGAILGLVIYCRQYVIDIDKMWRLMLPFFPMVHAFGRLGCFFAGCCYGIEYHGRLAVNYPYNSLIPELSSVPRVPVQLFEAICDVGLFAFLYFLSREGKKGISLLQIYLGTYAVIRFLLEFLRGDSDRGKYAFISTSQILSVAVLLFVVIKNLWKHKSII